MTACCHGVVPLKSTGDRPVPVAALTQTKSASTKRILNSPLEAQKMEAATSGTIVLSHVSLVSNQDEVIPIQQQEMYPVESERFADASEHAMKKGMRRCPTSRA